MTIIAATAVFAFVFIMLLVGLTYFTQSAEQNRQVLRRMSRPMGDVEDVDITRKRKPTEHSIFSALADFNMLRSLEEMMWQAGLYMRVSEMVLIIVLLFAAGALLGELFWKGPLFALGTGAAFGFLPILYIRFRRTRRIRAFVAQLPFALDLMKSSLEAGHSLQPRTAGRGAGVRRSTGRRVSHRARADANRTAAAAGARRHAQARTRGRSPSAGGRGQSADRSRQQPGADRRPAGRNRAYPSAAASTDQRADGAVTTGRHDRWRVCRSSCLACSVSSIAITPASCFSIRPASRFSR